MLETLPQVATWQLSLSEEALLAEYAAYRQASGYATDEHVRPWAARAFLRRYPDLESWRYAPLAEQLGVQRSLKYFVNFLLLKHYLRAPVAYLLAARPRLAWAGRRDLYAEACAQLQAIGRRLGYVDSVLEGILNLLFYVMAYAGKSPTELTAADLDAFEHEMRTYHPVAERPFSLRTFSAHLYGVRLLLFHAGVLPQAPKRFQANPARPFDELWREVPESIRQVARRYLDQLRTVRVRETVTNEEGYLRHFFAWLVQKHPEVTSLLAITRPHIEEYKLWLRNTPCITGKPYHVHTIAGHLSTLRCFFQALREWEWPEAPQRQIVFASDLPLRDEPLPRFLDDAQAAALLQAVRAADDLFTRVCVETLLRTGLRKGEFIRLEMDSVVQIGDTFWLRVPLGKLHNDRYVPLHPDVKRLLDEWVAYRGDQPWTTALFVAHGRTISLGTVDEAVRRAAQAAGLEGKVSPHRLRHTLATQAINRGMSLEAIAALLGHRSLTMTLIYARIANKTVRDQYFAVCDSLDAMYTEAALGSASAPAKEKNGQ
jgi:site-specific recombinase XerD